MAVYGGPFHGLDRDADQERLDLLWSHVHYLRHFKGKTLFVLLCAGRPAIAGGAFGP